MSPNGGRKGIWPQYVSGEFVASICPAALRAAGGTARCRDLDVVSPAQLRYPVSRCPPGSGYGDGRALRAPCRGGHHRVPVGPRSSRYTRGVLGCDLRGNGPGRLGLHGARLCGTPAFGYRRGDDPARPVLPGRSVGAPGPVRQPPSFAGRHGGFAHGVLWAFVSPDGASGGWVLAGSRGRPAVAARERQRGAVGAAAGSSSFGGYPTCADVCSVRSFELRRRVYRGDRGFVVGQHARGHLHRALASVLLSST